MSFQVTDVSLLFCPYLLKYCFIDNRNYSEDFDNIFDRGGVNEFTNNRFLFIGRIRREWKGESTESLIQKSCILSKHRHKIKEVELNKYSHIYSNQYKAIIDLIKSKNYNISAIRTRQFVDSYAHMIKSLGCRTEINT